MLLVINLPLIGMWVKLLQVPYKFLYPRSWCSAASAPTP
jgi:TctA family transporter